MYCYLILDIHRCIYICTVTLFIYISLYTNIVHDYFIIFIINYIIFKNYTGNIILLSIQNVLSITVVLLYWKKKCWEIQYFVV